MTARERRTSSAAVRGRAMNATVLTELRGGRLDRGLDGADVAREAALSAAQYSRIERGLTRSLSIEQASILLGIVGLELRVAVYPAGEPLRDAAHVALIARFKAVVHPTLRILTEVPFPGPADRRAWDAVVIGTGWRHGVEAETRPRDRQALERRLALKLRDGDVGSMTLLLLDSRHNRDFVRANADILAERFPVPGRRTVELVRAGLDPGGSSIVLL